jgi:1-acyl-sn-glycerol-3-phosphate acyltransferase
MKIILWLRSVLFVFLILPLITFLYSGLGLLHYLATRNQSIFNRYAKHWARALLWYLNAKVTAKGEENIPAGSCLYLFNHTSYVDIFAMQSRYSHIKYGAKIELFSVPLFGPALKAAGMLPIARGQREEVFKIYQEAVSRTAKGEQFALSPEGGRNAEETLLPFKSGPFIFAINAQIPMVPIIIKGAHFTWNKKSFLPQWQKFKNEISIEFLKPIPTVGYNVDSRSELQKKTFEAMKVHFRENV